MFIVPDDLPVRGGGKQQMFRIRLPLLIFIFVSQVVLKFFVKNFIFKKVHLAYSFGD